MLPPAHAGVWKLVSSKAKKPAKEGKEPHYFIFPEPGVTGAAQPETYEVIHLGSPTYGTIHTSVVDAQDPNKMKMDYTCKDNGERKYKQPKVNLMRTTAEDKTTLHETTDPDQRWEGLPGLKDRDSTWLKVKNPDVEWVGDIFLAVKMKRPIKRKAGEMM